MTVIQGRLVGSPVEEYKNHRLIASFSEKLTVVETSEPIWKTSEQRIEISNGRFTLTLPERDNLKNSLLLKVVAADGEVLIAREFLLDEVESEIEIEVIAKPFFELGRSDDPYLGKKSKLTGRVLDLDGKRQISNKQVILLARKADATNFALVLAAQTDRQGYFSAEYPREKYVEAYGLVSIGTNEHIPIQLQDGQFPKHVILAIRAPEEVQDDRDCDCEQEVPRTPDGDELINGTYSTDLGGGKCVNFTVPNRTLEEFSFYTIVRTTEPEIKGLTLEEPRRISGQLLATIAGLPILSQQSNQIEGAISVEATAVTRTLQLIDPLVISTLALAQPNPNDLAANDLVNAARAMAVDSSKATTTTAAMRLERTIPLNPSLVKAFVSDPDSFTIPNLMTAERFTAFGDLTNILNTLKKDTPSRSDLSANNSVDWDDEPTFYQATTVAHGHILHFKQVWKADGYSMGDLLYSLPLAPCQKKQIVTIDWDRREVGTRTEQLESEEQLNAVLTRDRDIGEIVNSTLAESLRGGSEASTWAAGGGLGLAIGPLVLGAAGGGGGASSTAWQNSSRNLAANSLQQLRDRTMQSASAVRSQRSTVVQTVRQGESMRVQTEVVTNHNHCHAITMQYFEVLRHFAIEQQLADVQECLFVPLLMSKFDNAKALRWREPLRRYLRNNSMRGAFNAIERIRNNYVGSDLPTGRYAQETVEYLDGELRISFQLARPRDKADETFEETAWALYAPFLWAAPVAIFNQFFVGLIQAERDRIFQQQVAPRIAEAFVQSLKFYLIGTNGQFEVKLDPTLVSDYASNTPLYVSLRPAANVPAVAREWITRFEIRSNYPLPAYSKAIVRNGSIRYRTKYMSHFLFRDWRIENDLLPGDPVQIPTFLDRQELRNPREEDRELAKQLIAHLNENLEYYHRAIWWSMDSERRYMLLDGFIAPNSNGRSVASVVENRLIGIIGNSLIMPVARGFKLDPTYRQDLENPINLLEHYVPSTPIPPMRVSVPTRGVYGESVMGACNSCEVKDDTRFWRFEESPCGDEPTPIQSPGSDSRRVDPGNLQPKDLPTPIINIQNSPSAPDPTGLASALQILGTPGIFKDITGLDANQRNALAAFQSALAASQSFGGEAAKAVQEAAKLEQQKTMQQNSDRTFQAIRQAQSSGLISREQAAELTQEALQSMIGSSPEKSPRSLTEQPEVRKILEGVSSNETGESSVRLERGGGGEPNEIVDIVRNSNLSGFFGAGSKPPKTIGKKSSKADALAKVAQYRASSATSPWKLNRTALYDRLEELVNNPSFVDQNGLNLCGPAAFLKVWVARDPLAVVEFAGKLYDTGKSSINGYSVEPDNDSLIAEDYTALKTAYGTVNGSKFTPEAEWMIMGAIRDAENFWFDFEGKPEETASAGTSPGEVVEWLEAANLYSAVKDEANWFLTKGIDHAKSLKPGPTRDIVLLINAHILVQANVTNPSKKSDEFILSAFPNHFIVLTSEIKETTDGKLTFNYWSWGQYDSCTINKSVFDANYYGAVIGESAAP